MANMKWICYVFPFVGVFVLSVYHVTRNRKEILLTSQPVKSPLPFFQVNFVESHPLPPTNAGNSRQSYLDVICVFPLMDTQEWSKTRYSNLSYSSLLQREKEYIYTLKTNLNHPALAMMHLFTHKPKALFEKLTKQYGVDVTKVMFHNSTANPTYEEVFAYASQFLQGRFVMILNADNYMGDGFTELDLGYLRLSKTMYSLTRRWPVPLPPKCALGLPSHCEDKSVYQGSHDAFLFYLDSPLPQAFLKELRFPSHVFGSENVVIWAFQKIIKFAVLNPCKKVHIHHLHCSAVRASGRIRVNRNGKSGLAGFTESLYVKKVIPRS